MEPILINSSNWNEREEVKKGKIGERIVFDYLRSKGFVVYRPAVDGSHPFDNLCYYRKRETMFIVEVKTKQARKFYPDTGISFRNYIEYKFIQDRYNLQVYLFFVDATSKKVYGNSLSRLEFPKVEGNHFYPLKENGIVYFPLSNMVVLFRLTMEQVKTINEHSIKSM